MISFTKNSKNNPAFSSFGPYYSKYKTPKCKYLIFDKHNKNNKLEEMINLMINTITLVIAIIVVVME
jgi:hypothetical protein